MVAVAPDSTVQDRSFPPRRGLVILEGIEEGQGYTFRRPLIGGPIASRAHLVGIFHEKIVGNPYWGAVAGGVRIPTYILS